jgi:predicted dehydrogenase
MDWGPYDMATLFDLLRPRRVEVRDAWLAQPATGADPADTVFDVETDVGAALRVTLDDGRSLPIQFGRASGTHAVEVAQAQFLGTRGALVWTPFDSHAAVRVRVDDGRGAVVEREVPPPPREDLEIFDRPLVEFVAALRGRPSRASLGAAAVDEFRCLHAIAECARTGRPQTVEVRG